ncbi:MAG: DUF554 domain-containing protein [Lachnospiraceae bacterium]|nr:DUF554 domain-containing protein [Lachnospiraceae bacterium]
MPTGSLVNCSGILIGSLVGAMLKNHLPKRLSEALPNIFGLCAITMGISLITNMENLSAVMLALICGAVIGELLHMEDYLILGLSKLEARMPGNLSKERMEQLVSMVVLFCFSGTGIFGAIMSGITQDHSILYAKTVLDFFTAVIFGSTIGYMLALVAIPQLLVQLILYYSSELIYPFMTNSMMNDFKALGGVITLAVGLKISGIKKSQVLNMLPGLVLVFFFSWFWTQYL